MMKNQNHNCVASKRNTGGGDGISLQFLETSELRSETALGGSVNCEDDLALVFGQRLITTLLC